MRILSFLFLSLLSFDATAQSKYIEAVDEYVPAPGQFVNTLPAADATDTPATMAAKCTERLAAGAGGMVTLGAWGGYITFHFDHPVANVPGQMDLYIAGNSYEGNCEAGIVMVSQDVNHNGLPDDVWYELSGSADVDSVGRVVYGYELTYTRQGDLQNVPWTDNRGAEGTVPRNSFHAQEYFPLWLAGSLTFTGTLLPTNARNTKTKGEYWVLSGLRYGYVDDKANTDTLGNSFNLEWAVHPVSRQPVNLTHVDFVRVYTALNQVCGWIGETSTEVTGAEDLHLEASLQQAAHIRQIAAAAHTHCGFYDLQGRLVNRPGRGIYIKNGKKFIH